jgi:1-aminocyclopropane-1-carboxylate deaminase/D-cysteine desulfhydrase-like pyridoxal-dependent ACC family enzyme
MRLAALDALPRRAFAHLPTPLQPAPSLTKALVLKKPLWVKRDDLTGPGLGGNKVRKLEYLLADSAEQGANCVVTVGTGQSNHARLTAILGAVAGMDVHLVLGGGSPVSWEGNLLLDRLGSTAHVVESEDWERLAESRHEVAEDLRRAGWCPYEVPMGGSTAVGALGYVDAYLELLGQLDAADIHAGWIVHASSTGGTQAGLLAGRAIAGRGPRIFGVDVAKGGPPLRDTVLRIAREALERLRSGAEVNRNDVITSDFTGEAYGAVTDEAALALVKGLRAEGLLFDPVYSAKALAALAPLDSRGALEGEEAIVFLHTGGQPALFTDRYATEVLKRGSQG